MKRNLHNFRHIADLNGNKTMRPTLHKYTHKIKLKRDKTLQIKYIIIDPRTLQTLQERGYLKIVRCKPKKHKKNKVELKLQRCIRWIKRRQAQDRLMKRIRKPADQVL